MRPYLLLTPGPLTTSETVKEAMMSDWCTWDEDYNVGIVEKIRKELVTLATSRPEDYTAVLMQGSGTFCVESTLAPPSAPQTTCSSPPTAPTATAWVSLPPITASNTMC